MFHKIYNSILALRNIIEPESWIFIIFILSSMNIGTFRPYLLIVAMLVVFMYFINYNLINSVWLSFVGVYLLRQSKYFTSPYLAPDNYMSLGLRQPEIIYSVAFADTLLILLVCLLVRQRLKTKHKPYKIPPRFPFLQLLILIVIGVASSMVSSVPMVSWFWLLQLTKMFIMTFLAMTLTKDKRIAKKTLEIIFIYGIFLAVLVIAQKFNGGPIGLAIEEKYTEYAGRFADESLSLYRPGGIFWDANLASSIFTMLLPAWYIFSFKKEWFHQGFMMTCLAIGVLALVVTASRAAWVVGIFILLLSHKLVVKKIQTQLSARLKRYGWIVFGIFIIFATPMVLNRLISLTQVFKHGGGAVYRLRHFQMAAYFLVTRPLGIVLNVYQYAILHEWNPKFYLYDSTPAHNLFAQVGASLGIGGLIVFIKFIHNIFTQGVAWINGKNKTLTKALVLGCLSYFLVSQFYPWWLTIPISGIMWLFLGMAYAQH